MTDRVQDGQLVYVAFCDSFYTVEENLGGDVYALRDELRSRLVANRDEFILVDKERENE